MQYLYINLNIEDSLLNGTVPTTKINFNEDWLKNNGSTGKIYTLCRSTHIFNSMHCFRNAFNSWISKQSKCKTKT